MRGIGEWYPDRAVILPKALPGTMARMQVRKVNVASELGLHARLAAQIAHLASRFSSSVSLAVRGRRANARNVLAVMLLAAHVGSTISIEASGADEAEVADALASLIGEGPR